MIRIVVAEDQPLILKDLCHKIEKYGSDVSVVATAANGKSAFEQTERLRPDILFTDIKMPFLSGLEVIARLKEKKLPVHTVIISGFRDFEFAREAMKLGVDEYLLKPLSDDDVAYVLQELKEKIYMNKQDSHRLMLESLIQSHPPAAMQNLMALPYGSYCILLVSAGSYPTFLLDYAISHGNSEVFLPLEELCREMEGPYEKAYFFQGAHHKERICLMCFCDGCAEGKEEKSAMMMARRFLLTTAGGRLPMTVCLSRRIRHAESIGMEVQIIRTYTERNIIFGKASVLEAKPFEMHMPKLSPYLPEARLQRLKLCAGSCDTAGFLAELTGVLDELERGNVTQLTVDYCLKKLFKDCVLPHDDIDMDLEIDEYISNSNDYHDLLSYLKFFTAQVIRPKLPKNGPGSDAGILVADVEFYMENNYAANININEIAAAFSLTPAYFSRMFKKQTGKKPIEYLTDVRMKNACQYFAASELSVRQVAELCGYSDQYYFSRAFKAATGKSPTEYRIGVRT